MKEKFENFSRFTEEDVKFFNELVEKYKEHGMRQDVEYLIIDKEDKEIYLLKERHMPVGGEGRTVPMEDYVRQILELDEKKKHDSA